MQSKTKSFNPALSYFHAHVRTSTNECEDMIVHNLTHEQAKRMQVKYAFVNENQMSTKLRNFWQLEFSC